MGEFYSRIFCIWRWLINREECNTQVTRYRFDALGLTL